MSPPSIELPGTKLLRLYISSIVLDELDDYGGLNLADCGLTMLWWYEAWWSIRAGGAMVEGEPYAFENLAGYLAALNGSGRDVRLADMLAAERVVQRIKRMLVTTESTSRSYRVIRY